MSKEIYFKIRKVDGSIQTFSLSCDLSSSIKEIKQLLSKKSLEIKSEDNFKKPFLLNPLSHGRFTFIYLGRLFEDNMLLSKFIQQDAAPVFSTIHVLTGYTHSLKDFENCLNKQKLCEIAAARVKAIIKYYNFENAKKTLLSMANSDPKGEIARALLESHIILSNPKCTDELLLTPSLTSTYYLHEISQRDKGRFHLFSVKSNGLGERYTKLSGDHLKSKILKDFKKQLQRTNTFEETEKLGDALKETKEYKILQRGQGCLTRLFRLSTSSVISFEKMLSKQKTTFLKNNSFIQK